MINNMKRLLYLWVLTVLLTGCSGSKNEVTDSMELVNNQPATEKIDKDSRKLIKEANLRFRTNDIQQSYSSINSSLKKYGAYISEENTFNSNSRTGVDLIIRVPSDRFDSLLNSIVANVNIRELENKSTEIIDVTEEFIDIQARIKIKKESEQQLTDLLRQSKNLSETLEIQKQLTDLRADIESIEGRLKYLAAQVDYSTLKVSFYEHIQYSERFFSDFWDALRDGWQVFLHIITLLTYLWVVILVFFMVRWGYKRYNRRNSDKI